MPGNERSAVAMQRRIYHQAVAFGQRGLDLLTWEAPALTTPMPSRSTAWATFGWRDKLFRRIFRPLRTRSRSTFGGELDLGPLRYRRCLRLQARSNRQPSALFHLPGGSQADEASGIAVDSSGAAYVAGGTQSNNFPITPGAYQTTNPFYSPNQMPAYGGDGFVTKIDNSGDLVYSTLTGLITGIPTPLVVDSTGQAYVSAGGFPSTIQPTCAGPPNQAVLVLNSTGSALVGSSPIPGPYLAWDGKGGLYSAGTAFTLVFFSTPRAFQTQYAGGDSDAFAAKVDFSQPAGPNIASVINAASLFPDTPQFFRQAR